MKFIARLKTKPGDYDLSFFYSKLKDDLLNSNTETIDPTLVNNIQELNTLEGFLTDIVDQDWNYKDEVIPPDGNFYFGVRTVYRNCLSRGIKFGLDNGYTHYEPIELKTLNEFFFILSYHGDKLVIRLDDIRYAEAKDCQYFTSIGYSGSQKQLQDYMRLFNIASSSVEKVFLNDFNSKTYPEIISYYKQYPEETICFYERD